MLEFENLFSDKKLYIEKLLSNSIGMLKFMPQKKVAEAMEYSLMAGGKRIRPMLLNEAYIMYGGCENIVTKFMIAIEMIHTYSLIHDDLPAMDNDDLRRGKPTNHKVYGEDIAILAGDGLLNLAFETVINSLKDNTNSSNIIKSIEILSNKSGVLGMIGGQVLDLANEKSDELFVNDIESNLKLLQTTAELKTAALIEASLMIGACLAGANDNEIKRMELIGHKIGLAFQMQDDLLDVSSTTDELGKPVGSDVKNNKLTFVNLLGVEDVKCEINRLTKDAITILNESDYANVFLENLIINLIDRNS